MIAVDSSVAIAAFAAWHEANSSARAVLARRPRIPAHVLVETYSVLTRMPAPHRAPADVVVAFLAQAFRKPPLTLPGGEWLRFLEEVQGAGITGGGIYDALIGATARRARATLFTRDRRASSVYERLGVSYELMA